MYGLLRRDPRTGAHVWNRTIDLLLTKEVLYRLSYVSMELLVAAWSSMERETGIEPAPSAWKAEVIPLNYSRDGQLWICREHWWREVDSKHRRRKPADLHSATVVSLDLPTVVQFR